MGSNGSKAGARSKGGAGGGKQRGERGASGKGSQQLTLETVSKQSRFYELMQGYWPSKIVL